MSSLSVSDGKAIISAGAWFEQIRPEVLLQHPSYCNYVLIIPLLDGELRLVVSKDDVSRLHSCLEQFMLDQSEGKLHLPNQKEGNIVPILDSIASIGNG